MWGLGLLCILILVPVMWIYGIKAYLKYKNKKELK